jgi:eukaryotic-like serine/threonine-protein kinase
VSTSYPTPVDGIPYQPPPPPVRRGPSRRTVVLALVGAVLGGIVLGGVIALTGDDTGPGTTTSDGQSGDTGAQIEPASVVSFDPVRGSGFRDGGDGTWSTQTYTTADFGGLKPGVGLLIDLGEKREVSSVTMPSATAGLAVELLAGDEKPSGNVEGMSSADSATTKASDTSLSGADAGAHRYWMVWVTQLAPSEGGFSATVASPVVRESGG